MKYVYNILEASTKKVLHRGLRAGEVSEELGINKKSISFYALSGTACRGKIILPVEYFKGFEETTKRECKGRTIIDEDGNIKLLPLDIEELWNSTMESIRIARRKWNAKKIKI